MTLPFCLHPGWPYSSCFIMPHTFNVIPTNSFFLVFIFLFSTFVQMKTINSIVINRTSLQTYFQLWKMFGRMAWNIEKKLYSFQSWITRSSQRQRQNEKRMEIDRITRCRYDVNSVHRVLSIFSMVTNHIDHWTNYSYTRINFLPTDRCR